jgi:hypothetical protein
VSSPLPEVIDLGAPNPSVKDEPIEAAVAAFGIAKYGIDSTVFDGVMLVTADGELRHLDATRLQLTGPDFGASALPFEAGTLSPDGSRLAFQQPGQIAIYDLPSNQWTSYDVASGTDESPSLSWSTDGSYVRVGVSTIDLGSGQVTTEGMSSPLDNTDLHVSGWWGVEHVRGQNHARMAQLDESVPLEGVAANPPAIVVTGSVDSLLAIPDRGQRSLDCCTVAGWLDDETVAYDSRLVEPEAGSSAQTLHVLAWNVRSGNVGLVSTVTGTADMYFAASYADLG